MREYVKRLIDCGFSREMALAVCRNYTKQNKWRDLERYIEDVEREDEYDFEEEERAR